MNSSDAHAWWMVIKEMVQKGYRFEIDEETVSIWPEDANRWEYDNMVRYQDIDQIGRAVLEAAQTALKEKPRSQVR